MSRVKSRWALFALAAAAVAVVILAGGRRSTAPQQAAAPIADEHRGTVHDTSAGAIAGAIVRAVWISDDGAPREIARTQTSPQGAYQLRVTLPLEHGVLLLAADAEGYGTTERRVDPGITRQDFVLLRGSTTVRLDVVDAQDRPVAIAEVVVSLEPQSAEPDAMIVFSGTSDANGQFVAAGLPVVAGTLHWSAVARGTGRGFGTHPKRDGDAPIAIVARLDPGSTLIGQVVDDAGRPVSGAPLRVAETDGPWAEATQSDATGQFRVAGAPHEAGLALGVGGDWVLVNGQEVVPVLTPKQGDPALVRLVVEPAGAISGRVTGAGRELARATIVATATDRALAATRETVSGADGSFTFRGLRSTTTWEIEARHPKYAPAFVERVSASTRGLELRLAAGGAITGRVIDGAHRAYRGVEVYAQRVSQTGSEIVGLREYASVRSDADGTFLLDHLNPGPYRVEYRAPAHMQFAPTATVLRQADVVDAAVTTLDDAQIGRGGRLHIVVQANATPQWLTVSILPTGQGGAPHQAQLWGARNGAFEMEDVAPGVYDISGQSRDIGHARAPAVRVEPDTTTELVLPFAAGLALHGSVVDARGRPIAGARVDAYLATSGSQQTHSIPGRAPDNFSGNWTFSQDDGSFHLAGLVAGAHTLRVSKADQPPIERTVAVAPNAPALEVRLPDPARLAVLIPGGARGADKVVLAETDDGGGHHASAITDPRGTAQFEALPPGKYQVKAIIADAPVKTIVLRAGESKQITLEVTQ